MAASQWFLNLYILQCHLKHVNLMQYFLLIMDGKTLPSRRATVLVIILTLTFSREIGR